jgi:Flp pilus assembly protein TadD
VLSRQLLQLLEVDEFDADRFWDGFKRVVALDISGEQVRSVVDALYNIDDMTLALYTLKTASQREPNRSDLHLNLAAAYLIDEDGDKAKVELKMARRLTSDPLIHADIDRLMLVAEDPDFEARIGEITDIVSAGNQLDTDDVEFLEGILEKAPSFAEGYLLLARSYGAWDELSSAIEVLLDGHEHLPDDPEIATLLARLLWDSGEQELAFSYLNQGVAKNPSYVPLLALTGRYLFEDGQQDAAKAYLARAELITPNDPVLIAARAHIAKLLSD